MFIWHLFVGNQVPILITTSALCPRPTPTKFVPSLLLCSRSHHHILDLCDINRPRSINPIPISKSSLIFKTTMAADSSFSSSTTSSLLLGVMDHLWFHHIILFSEPSSLKPVLSTPASKSSSNNSQISSTSGEENRAFLDVHTSTTIKQDNGLFDEQEFEKKTESRSSSSSPSSHKKQGLKNYVKGGNGNGMYRLKKTMSCKSLCELELEEVKGFMDLGFRFSKDHLISKRMMSLIPGLQRLEEPFFKIEEKNILEPEEDEDEDDDDEEEEEEERCNKIRPYLSEAWLIKRPDSPLLNLRIPRVSATADMKKHLKYWAKTVASAIQQDS